MSWNTPHDALVHKVFSNIQNAVGELRAVLPKPIAERIDWSTLRLEAAHHTDTSLETTYSDFLYSCKFAGYDLFIYVLLEHQSTADPMMALRFLDYATATLREWRSNHPQSKTVPPVFPVLLSHVEGGWTQPTSMRELYNLPGPLETELLPYLPDFRFVVDDLTQHSDEELLSRALESLGKLGLLLLRHGREDKSLSELLARYVELVHAVLMAPDGLDAFRTVLRYALLVNKETTVHNLKDSLIPLLGHTVDEAIMTEGERLIAQGEAKGEVKGEAKGRAAALLAFFNARGIVVPAALQTRITSCTDIPTLDRWIRRAATASSAEEALADA